MWKPINDKYSISNTGQVRNDKTGKILKPELHSKGYHRITLYKKRYFVHRLVALAFIPNLENKPQVNHIDYNKLNNHYSNLEWMTNKENNIHSFKHGRISGATKLSIESLKEIIHELDNNPKCIIKDLANKYSVTTMAIHAIKQGYNRKRIGM